MVGKPHSRDIARDRRTSGVITESHSGRPYSEGAPSPDHYGFMRPCSRDQRLLPARVRNGVLRDGYSETDPAQLLCRPLGTQRVISEWLRRRDRSLRHCLARTCSDEDFSDNCSWTSKGSASTWILASAFGGADV